MVTKNNSLALSFHSGSIIDAKVGGLKALNSLEENIFCLYSYAEDIFKALKILDSQSFWKGYSLVSISLKREHLKYFLLTGWKMGYCDFKDLKSLYLIQNKEKRIGNDAFALEDLFSITCWNRDLKSKESLALVQDYKQEILDLANQVISINTCDMYLFFQQWFYRDSSVGDAFSIEFYEYWYSKTTGTFPDLTGKLGSLFMIAYQAKFPEKDIFSDLLETNKKLIRRDTTSHGIHRYFSLLYMMAGEDSEKIKKISPLWCLLIETLIRKGDTFHAEFSLEIVLRDVGIPKEQRDLICSEVTKSCISFGEEITEFLEKVCIEREKLV